MNIGLIRSRVKKVSSDMEKADTDALIQKNEKMQDFLLWLLGYMDGIEQGTNTVKMVLDKSKFEVK